MSEELQVLVTGATGTQGGALARELLRRGHTVKAFTRHPRSPAAIRLATSGATICEGNFDDPESLRRAARGADVAFVLTTPFEGGPDAERRQGIAAVDAASRVDHILLSSVASASERTGIRHFESKRRVEEHLEDTGHNYTIVGPAFFMENTLGPWMLPGLQQGRYVQALPADRSLQMICAADIGFINAEIIERRDDFLGHRLDIATDSITGPEAAKAISAASGRHIDYVMQPVEQLKAADSEAAAMFEWLNRVGYSVDIPELHKDFPDAPWISFAAWAKLQDWHVLEPAVRTGSGTAPRRKP